MAATETIDEPLWTDVEVAEYIRSTPAAVRQMRYRGEGPPVIRIGRRIRHDPAKVRRWAAEHGEETS